MTSRLALTTKLQKYISDHFLHGLKYLLRVHLMALGVMSAFRLLMLCTVWGQLPEDVRHAPGMHAQALLRGIWFDNVVACYILALPLLVVTVAGALGYYGGKLVRPIGIFFGTAYCLVLMACAGNIPYFAYFTKVLNSSIWNWAEDGGTALGMMFTEVSYYLYIAAFFLAFALFCWGLRRMGKAWRSNTSEGKTQTSHWIRNVSNLALGLALCGLCMFGIRGRTGYNPIKVSAAYFCDNPILNQLGVNPAFCLLQSTLDDRRAENKRLHLMDDDKAVAQSQLLLGRKGLPHLSPLAREVKASKAPTRQNVVLILMESMSAKLTGTLGGTSLTPELDKLAKNGLSFTNCYSAGTHTNHGLYATLYSFPSIMKRNAMKGSAIPNYSGLPTVLAQEGYHTLFFMTHEAQYDNMNAFLRTNGYQDVYAEENYPKEKIANHFGIPDDYLFEYALPVLRRSHEAGRPFFATLLTISNHPPYVLPKGFQGKSKDMEMQIVEYADRCIGDFMRRAAQEEWYENTIFVFVGDHGKMVGQADCELPESYNHVPLIFYGKGISPQTNTSWAGQVDISATILGMLGISYTQNNFGVDLLQEQRPCIFYTADNTVAARSEKHLYVYNPDAEKEFCYDIQGSSPQPVAMNEEHQQLKEYCFSMLQATEVLVEQGKTLDK